jgi:hypothetical protein
MALVCLSGCIPLCYHSYDRSYPGLQERLNEAVADNATLHIVTVHGIGDHLPGYSTNFADRVALELGLSKQGTSKPKPLVSKAGFTNWLWEYGYSEGNKRMIIHEVTWSPTTSGIKTAAFEKDMTLNPHRVLLNKSLKVTLLDRSLSDAVLYLNPEFRDAMQEPILQTIQQVSSQTDSNDCIVIVTHSLGSKMTFDTAIKYEERPEIQHFEERTTDILMLANQLPLLHLGTATNMMAEIGGGRPQTAIKKFLSHSQQHKQKRVKAGHPPAHETTVHIVAATDPNDLLSYPLSDSDVVPDDGNTNNVVSLSNIYSHNAWVIPFLLENPESAHDNYYYNKWLIKKLVRGYGKQ